MPLDRIATLRLAAAGTRDDQGVYTPGEITDYRVWASRIDAPVDRNETKDGTRVTGVGRFRVRWFRALADHDVGLEGQILIDGTTWRITTINEVDNFDARGDSQRALRTRRRWIELTADRIDRA